MDMNTIELWLDQEITLWALTVFLARGGETSLETSVNGLPPVDLLFSHEKVVVEVQGAHHHIDKEKN